MWKKINMNLQLYTKTVFFMKRSGWKLVRSDTTHISSLSENQITIKKKLRISVAILNMFERPYTEKSLYYYLCKLLKYACALKFTRNLPKMYVRIEHLINHGDNEFLVQRCRHLISRRSMMQRCVLFLSLTFLQ